MLRPTFAAVVLLCTGASVGAQTRWLVPQQLPTLAAAVAAATDGDVIELQAGIHLVGGLRIGKGLTIVGSGAAIWGGQSGEPLTLAIPAGQELTLQGVALSHPFLYWGVALVLEQCLGRVTILDCSGVGTIQITGCDQVLLGGCTVRGARTSSLEGSPAHAALRVSASTVVLDRCAFIGPGANYETSTAANLGATVIGADVRCIDTLFRGGDAAVRLGVPALPGVAAVQTTASRLRLTGPVATASAGAFAGVPALVVTGGQLSIEPGQVATMTLAGGATLVRETRPRVLAVDVVPGRQATLMLVASSGAFGALAVSFPGDRVAVPGAVGDLWLDAVAMCVPTAGALTGALAWSVAVPAGWQLPVQVRWQGAILNAGGLTLTDPGAALLR